MYTWLYGPRPDPYESETVVPQATPAKGVAWETTCTCTYNSEPGQMVLTACIALDVTTGE